MKTANRRRSRALKNRAQVNLDECLQRSLQNPDFRAAYDAEDKRIELELKAVKKNL